MIKIILLLSMIFCHIVDDYYLQGFLASAKQKSYWKKNYPEEMYKNDYIIALIEHAFSWTFMINVPIMLYIIINGISIDIEVFVSLFIFNLMIHAVVDNFKANLFKINLIQDQLVHIFQIIYTWFIYMSFI